jgi:hypothetical protein
MWRGYFYRIAQGDLSIFTDLADDWWDLFDCSLCELDQPSARAKGSRSPSLFCPRERSNLRREERELKALGQLRLRGVERSDPDELERFYRLEASGRKGRERSAILCDRRSVQFFSEVAREAARLNFSLNMLELDGKLLAARFGLTCGRATTPRK